MNDIEGFSICSNNRTEIEITQKGIISKLEQLIIDIRNNQDVLILISRKGDEHFITEMMGAMGPMATYRALDDMNSVIEQTREAFRETLEKRKKD